MIIKTSKGGFQAERLARTVRDRLLSDCRACVITERPVVTRAGISLSILYWSYCANKQDGKVRSSLKPQGN
jgi:hypothetical protein